MIDPTLLTPENGFEDGVVVEINGKPYVYDYFGKYAYGFVESLWCKDGPVFKPEDIKSIKLLTGPMSIWNHAPEWVEWCKVSKLNITWWDHEPPKTFDWHEVSSRPFWATRSGE